MVFPLSRWCPPQETWETSQLHPPPQMSCSELTKWNGTRTVPTMVTRLHAPPNSALARSMSSGSVFYLWLSKVLANERTYYICNISHWLGYCWAIVRKWPLTKHKILCVAPFICALQGLASTVACHCFNYHFRVSIAPPLPCINIYTGKGAGRENNNKQWQATVLASLYSHMTLSQCF